MKVLATGESLAYRSVVSTSECPCTLIHLSICQHYEKLTPQYLTGHHFSRSNGKRRLSVPIQVDVLPVIHYILEDPVSATRTTDISRH